jgi:hypothetical protein
MPPRTGADPFELRKICDVYQMLKISIFAVLLPPDGDAPHASGRVRSASAGLISKVASAKAILAQTREIWRLLYATQGAKLGRLRSSHSGVELHFEPCYGPLELPDDMVPDPVGDSGFVEWGGEI